MPIEVFDTPGAFDWTPPENVFSVKATVISGGGAYPDWGSQGGSCVTAIIPVVPGVLIDNAIFVAISQEADTGNNNGFPSQFGTLTDYIIVFGGLCTNADQNGPATANDPPDQLGNSYTLVGGTLVSAYLGGYGTLAGGGGSSAGTASNGNNASGTIGGFAPVGGGAGGSLDGPNGFAPGGGAGKNGTGASGRVILEYTPASSGSGSRMMLLGVG